MSGVEVRLVQAHNRDAVLGDGADAENCGALELWRDGKRIVELTWWEQQRTDFESLGVKVELYTHLTLESDVHGGVSKLTRPR